MRFPGATVVHADAQTPNDRQFTYLGKPPIGKRLMKQLGLDARLLGLTVANFPPAFVYRFTRG